MKFKFEKDENRSEVIAYSKEKTELISMIESICFADEFPLVGYYENEIKELNALEIECFYTSNEKIYALLDKKSYLVKKRLYELNDLFKDTFIFINQGCLVNLNHIERFEVSIGGSLIVVMKSGYKDYVSRRQIKSIKERIGIK